MRIHDLRTWPSFFRALADGSKTFEVRRNDRDFGVGDVLQLSEWEPAGVGGRYTGREMRALITYVMRGGDFGIERGYVVIGFTVTQPLAKASSTTEGTNG